MEHANKYINDKHMYRPVLDALVDVGAISIYQAEEADKLLNNYAKQAEKRINKMLRRNQ